MRICLELIIYTCKASKILKCLDHFPVEFACHLIVFGDNLQTLQDNPIQWNYSGRPTNVYFLWVLKSKNMPPSDLNALTWHISELVCVFVCLVKDWHSIQHVSMYLVLIEMMS